MCRRPPCLWRRCKGQHANRRARARSYGATTSSGNPLRMCYGATNLRLSVLRRLRCEQEGAGMRTSAVSGRVGGAGGGLRGAERCVHGFTECSREPVICHACTAMVRRWERGHGEGRRAGTLHRHSRVQPGRPSRTRVQYSVRVAYLVCDSCVVTSSRDGIADRDTGYSILILYVIKVVDRDRYRIYIYSNEYDTSLMCHDTVRKYKL